MGISTILFDLDGTLLPMDQEVFARAYFGSLAKRLAPRGYDPEILIASILKGTKDMMDNDGKETNEAVFWKRMSAIYGDKIRQDSQYFDEYYVEDFPKVKNFCGNDPDAAKCVKELKKQGCRLALATNPLFPSIATRMRIEWAGLDIEDFEIVTTYENSCYSKPNLNYYKAILDSMKISAQEVLMVGNDVGDDMVAQQLGMKVFLLTRDLINRLDADISLYPRGDFKALMEYIESMK